jgi:hypothetical protein
MEAANLFHSLAALETLCFQSDTEFQILEIVSHPETVFRARQN